MKGGKIYLFHILFGSQFKIEDSLTHFIEQLSNVMQIIR
jgi:hypothetical protein